MKFSLLKTAALSAFVATSMGMTGCNSKTSGDALSQKAAMERIEKSVEKARKTTGPGHPAMWKMADDDTTVYLFGTVHLLPKDLEWKTQSFSKAFDTADKLIMEINASDTTMQEKMQTLLLSKAQMPDGKTLSSFLDEEQKAIVQKAAENVGLPYAGLENFQPWFSSLQMTMVSIMRNGYDPMAGVEQVLTTEAQSKGMSFGNLETVEEQINFLAGGTIEEQVEGLVFAAQTIDFGPEMLNALVEEWADGDVAGLSAMMGEPAMFGTKEAYETLIVKRNKNWIPKLETLLDEPGTKFVAVGAGHLSGPDSVIKMLQDKGHTVELVQ